jgi:hypothetical protein
MESEMPDIEEDDLSDEDYEFWDLFFRATFFDRVLD